MAASQASASTHTSNTHSAVLSCLVTSNVSGSRCFGMHSIIMIKIMHWRYRTYHANIECFYLFSYWYGQLIYISSNVKIHEMWKICMWHAKRENKTPGGRHMVQTCFRGYNANVASGFSSGSAKTPSSHERLFCNVSVETYFHLTATVFLEGFEDLQWVSVGVHNHLYLQIDVFFLPGRLKKKDANTRDW